MITKEKISVLASLKGPLFRNLWIGMLISNIGNKMHEVCAAWLMATLTTNSLWISLVQVAHALSISTLAVVAGALADILDKRQYLLCLQIYMLTIALLLSVITFYTRITPLTLLVLVIALDIGTALTLPTWQSLIPNIINKHNLKSAIIINGVSVNLPRTIGPALAGLLISIYGTATVFLLNAISFLGIIMGVFLFKTTKIKSQLPSEKLWGAVKAGTRYVKQSPSLHKIMVKSGLFFFFSTAFWSLFPLVAKINLSSTPLEYGIIYAFFGVGAVAGAFILPTIRQHVSLNNLILACSFTYFICMLAISYFQNYAIALILMGLSGLAWMAVSSSLNIAVQETVSPWVRARALSFYFIVFYGSMAIGGIFWGWVAIYFEVIVTLKIAGISLLFVNFLSAIYVNVDSLSDEDYSPISMLPLPSEKLKHINKLEPVLIAVEYRVEPINHWKFKEAIKELKRIRMREGAYFWSLFNDINNERRFIECFLVESWLEHVRYQERISMPDKETQLKVLSFHEGGKPHEEYLLSIL